MTSFTAACRRVRPSRVTIAVNAAATRARVGPSPAVQAAASGRQARGVADALGRGDELAQTFGRRALEGIAQVDAGQPAAAGGERVVGGAQGQRPPGAFGVGAGGPLAMAERQHELVQRGEAALRPGLADQPLHRERIAARIGGDRFDLRGACHTGRAGAVLDGAPDPRVRVVAEPRAQRVGRAGAGIGQRVDDRQPRRLGRRRVEAGRHQRVERARRHVRILGHEMRPHGGDRGGRDGRVAG